MIKAILSDFSRVILFPTDTQYTESLNQLYSTNKTQAGFSFFNHFSVNSELLRYYNQLKQKGLTVAMLTSESIQEAPELEPYLADLFTWVFSAKEIGLSKKQVEIYQFVAAKLIYEPREIVFIDDDVQNLQAAQQAGYKTIHFQTNDSVIKNKIWKT